jgi:hypothetical protein
MEKAVTSAYGDIKWQPRYTIIDAAKKSIDVNLKKSHYRVHKLFRFSSGDGEVNKLVAFTITRCGLDDGRFTLGNGAAGIPVSEVSGHTDAAGVGTASAAEAGVTNTHSNDSLTSI